MKKKIIITLAVVFVLLFVLFVPIPRGHLQDGGTRVYDALTYKIVRWNKVFADGSYKNTRVYFGRDRNRSIDELWDMEIQKSEEAAVAGSEKMRATVLEIYGNSVLVEPLPGESALKSSDKITFGITDLEDIDIEAGSIVEVYYVNGIMETYPAQIHAVSWRIATDLRDMEYTETWLDKTTCEKYDDNVFDHIRITKIYSNCFFARTVVPTPSEIKLNGRLSEDWCVGDQVQCEYKNTYYDDKTHRIEADMLSIEQSNWQPDPYAAYKPVIYLYPKQETKVKVRLDLNGEFTCSYPKYQDSWDVTAMPDGTLFDENGQRYNYLYWEGDIHTQYDFSRGFCVKGEDTAAFLEDALQKLGLTRREANEFIIYWLPQMEKNPYNVISFQNEAYTDAAKLCVEPKPDALIRVYMAWRKAESFVDLLPQELTAVERRGFTVVEWGGGEADTGETYEK